MTLGFLDTLTEDAGGLTKCERAELYNKALSGDILALEKLLDEVYSVGVQDYFDNH